MTTTGSGSTFLFARGANLVRPGGLFAPGTSKRHVSEPSSTARPNTFTTVAHNAPIRYEENVMRRILGLLAVLTLLFTGCTAMAPVSTPDTNRQTRDGRGTEGGGGGSY